jgi:heterodisulfide reductase subunit A
LSCPVGINAKGYVTAIAEGRFEQALAIVRDNNPLPSVCGRICSRPCETECTRRDSGGAIAIRALKRFVADFEQLQSPPLPRPLQPVYSERIAVVGSGPAGLTAAHDLARLGYPVTVFEKEATPGGLMVSAIPDFRLPASAVEYDIDIIARLGVDIKTESPVDNPKGLLAQGFAAVVVAAGAARLERTIQEGRIDYIDFMRRFKAGAKMPDGKRVAVIGCTQEAVDAARAAVRSGYDNVHLVFGRTLGEFPCEPEDLDLAEEEGVELMELTRVVSAEQGALRCVELESRETPFAGRWEASVKPGSEFSLDADLVIDVPTRKVDLSLFPTRDGFAHTRWGFLEVDPATLSTGVPGVYAAGEVVTGAKNVIEAMASGKRAAVSVHNYLRERRPAQIEAEPQLIFEAEHPEPVAAIEPRQTAWRKGDDPNAETEQRFKETAAVAEAARCMRCGPCLECVLCSSDCGKCTMVVSFEGRHTRISASTPAINALSSGEGEYSFEITEVYPPEITKQQRMPTSVQDAYCTVETAYCTGCGICQEVCRYSAALVEHREGRFVARIDRRICRACGACAAACPSGAIAQSGFTDRYFDEAITGILRV